MRGLPQLFLVEVERANGKKLAAVSPQETLHGGDILWFAGDLEGVASLQKIPGKPVECGYSVPTLFTMFVHIVLSSGAMIFLYSLCSGLTSHGDQASKLSHSKLDHRLAQAVVSPVSRLVGRTVKRSQFRTHFRAVIIGVHRQGQRLRQKIGDIRLHGGDVLLLLTGPQFLGQYRNCRDFALVSEVENSLPIRWGSRS